MFNSQEDYTSSIFFHFTELNLIIEMHLHLFVKTFQICFNNVSRPNHLSSMNNTVTNKIKYFSQFFILDPRIPSKRKWDYFQSMINH